MSQLTANTPPIFEDSGVNYVPVKASTEIFFGSAVGITAGYGRQLTAGDQFAGFAIGHVNNTSPGTFANPATAGTDGALGVPVQYSGRIVATISGVAVTNVGNTVYMSDGATFTLTAAGNSRVGVVHRFVATNTAVVRFDASNNNAIQFTDNTTGAVSTTLAAGVGVVTVPLYVNNADLAAADLLTTYTPGYAFKILGVAYGVEKAVTTGSKLATLTPKISGVAVTGGVLSLTSAALTPQGAVVAATAVTAANTGAATDTISITGSAVTAFVEGGGWIFLKIQNMDTANAVASLAGI